MSEEGSLRDMLHGVQRPLLDWSQKYCHGQGRLLKRREIAILSKMILEATLYLYECGLSPCGHIQSGNIFMTKRGCRLGGYENTLLGYKSRHHQFCQDLQHTEKIDILMIGEPVVQ